MKAALKDTFSTQSGTDNQKQIPIQSCFSSTNKEKIRSTQATNQRQALSIPSAYKRTLMDDHRHQKKIHYKIFSLHVIVLECL